MNVIVFGATGMVGGGVLTECLEDDRVHSVLSVGRRPCGLAHAKLREVVCSDLFALGDHRKELEGYDACLFCLGVSAAGIGEAAYRRVTYDLTIEAAAVLAASNPDLTFCYVSGQGTDLTGESRFMWARVKGETEARLLEMPFAAYMFRPGIIQPLKGARSRTRAYQAMYVLLGPLIPALKRLFPRHVTTTVKVGRAMLRVAADGHSKQVLETDDINRLA